MTCGEAPQPLSVDELRLQRSTILGIAAKRGASNVRVFGSVVRGRRHGD
jgi:predicted nucleotidyltransferase